MLLALSALLVWRYSPLVEDVRGLRVAAEVLAADARALTPSDLDRVALDRFEVGLADLDRRLLPIRALLEDDPLVGLARNVPPMATQVVAADALVSAAASLVEAGDLGLALADQLVTLQEADEADPEFPMMPGLVELVATSVDDVDRIGVLVDSASASLEQISPDAIGQIITARDLMAEPLAEYGLLLQQYREIDDVLPGLFGWGDEQTYLVLAQNPAELRPHGGYSGTVGIIRLRDGAIVEQQFVDVHKLDGQEGLPFVEAPLELVDHLLGEEQSWRLADAAWSPDFPEAASKALEFYELETGSDDVDGVIAVTTYALDRLLEVLGPVTVDEFGATVDAGEATITLLGETRGPGNGRTTETRKDILDALARTVMQRLLSLPPERWPAMLEAADDIGRERMALAWFTDERAQQLVVDAGWDGAVRADEGDYLYVVEANMAPTSKYNLVVDRSDSLVVRVAEDGGALSSLRLDWQNNAAKPGEPYDSLRRFSNNQDGWYGAYVKVLVPNTAELVTANGEASDPISGVGSITDESGRQAYGNYLLMPPGESTLTYLWKLPDAAMETSDGWEYRLVIQKQPGARAHRTNVRVDLPESANVIEAPPGASVEGAQVQLAADLSSDLDLLIRYQLDPTA